MAEASKPSKKRRPRGPVRRLRKGLRVFRRGAQNALELMQAGRIGSPYRAPYEIHIEERRFRLRRYLGPDEGARSVAEAVLLVPPLMVSSEIYDISPELSAVTWLTSQGLDVWLVDFGAPEEEPGGMDRTLDDHVLAVDRAVSHVAELTGAKVHLGGYSQGGMFVYQCAAYRKGEDLASLITFGSPVDIWRNLPVKVHDDLAGKTIAMARNAIKRPLEAVDGLPGLLTSTGFKVLSARKELKSLISLVGILPDKKRLKAVTEEPKRRFLGGEGFVAWPGPALREFIEQMVVQNRMASGGFVIAGRSVTLADIRCPILLFVGLRDEIAVPRSVRAIVKAAPLATATEIPVKAGHFGLVVGSRAMGEVWPAVSDWVNYHALGGPKPAFMQAPSAPVSDGEASDDPDEVNVELDIFGEDGTRLLYDAATEMVDGMWKGIGNMSLEMSHVIDTLRWQLPRLSRVKRIQDDSRINMGRALAEQAAAIPDKPFFLWDDRAFTYAEADARVNQVLEAMLKAGVARGQHVAVFMDNHPDYLTSVAALSRLGSVAVLLNSGLKGQSLQQALDAGRVDSVIADPLHGAEAATLLPEKVLVLSGITGGEVPDGCVDLESLIDRSRSEVPAGIEPNPGRGGDVAMLMFTSGTTGLPKAAKITNKRVMLAALGAAAGCRLSTNDTVYCCLPLYHATGLLVGVGSALVGGSRLALSPKFSVNGFWEETRRYGATVVFYVGELGRYLVTAPTQQNEKRHPVRIFAGNGMRPDVWEAFQERFGPVRILEFYGSTEGNTLFANLTGEKAGSIGRPYGPQDRVALVKVDPDTHEYVRDGAGFGVRVEPGEAGALLAKIGGSHPLGSFEGYLDTDATEQKIWRSVFEKGDAWFKTGDLLRKDSDGDYWFVDRLGDTFRWKGENVSTEQVASVLRAVPFVDMTSVYGVQLPGREGRAGMAAITLREKANFSGDELFAALSEHLFPAAHPRFIRLCSDLAVTDTHKLQKHKLRDEGADPSQVNDPIYVYQPKQKTYARLEKPAYEALLNDSPHSSA